jgi:hypothetical protein
MATPHVSAVGALVWSYHLACTAEEIRGTLDKSALDLGAPGRDGHFGFGLVQAKAAFDRIATLGCGKLTRFICRPGGLRVNGRRLGRRTAGVGRSEPSPFLNSGHSSPRKLPFAASSNIEAESDHAKHCIRVYN